MKYVKSNIKTVIAYHGSPYKFDNFKNNLKGKSGQIGAELGFWFTTDKKVATRFAQVYPDKMYKEIKELRDKYTQLYKKDQLEYVKNLNYNNLLKFLEEDEELNDKAEFNLKNYIKIKDYGKIIEFISALITFYGSKGFGGDIVLQKQILDFRAIEKKYSEVLDIEEVEIKKRYDEAKGYLYTVEINIGKQGIENGEDVGTNWGRHGTISQYEAEGYNSVLIKFADTGQGLCDEIVVFKRKDIKILDVEEL